MHIRSQSLMLFTAICLSPLVATVRAQDPADTVSAVEFHAGDDVNKTYFLMGPAPDKKAPAKGYGLLLIMPGGDGSVEFQPFIKNIYANAVPKGFLAVQIVAVKWTPRQQIVWPTRTGKVAGQKFTTEEFLESVIAEVGKKHPLDRRRIFTLSWSSSGPAAYAASWAQNSSITGSFVAMSVFRPDPAGLDRVQGRCYYIYHSKEDRTCPFAMAKRAADTLKTQGATTTFAEYSGGHGWHGDVFGDIRAGLDWLIEHADKPGPATSRPASAPAKASIKKGN